MNRTQGGQVPARVSATIRRPDFADLAALSGFFAGLSLRTRVQRFFAPVRPGPALVRLACGLAGDADALVATHGGVIIGHAMAAARPTAPEGQVTEIGVVVADAWQHRGVGSALVRALISRAQARGVSSLSMDVLPGNHDVLAMISDHWPAVRTYSGADCVTLQIGLSPAQPPRRSAAPARSRVRRRELASRP
ncbi:MAG TPA: GNAT family N-acetyltransferase [Streptosporangiaceae bacterium]